MILSLIIGILTLVAEWMIFKKMGRQGWEGIVPIYNTYVLCQELYGNGWKFLLLLIPIYNIYFVIKMNIDWAKAFNQGVGFGIGLLLLPFIFQLILAFGGDQYRDGSYTNTQPDMVENVVSKAKDAVSGNQDDHKEQYKKAAGNPCWITSCFFVLFFQQSVDKAQEHEHISFIQPPHPLQCLLYQLRILLRGIKKLLRRDLKVIADGKKLFQRRQRFTRRYVVHIPSAMP